MGIKLIAKHEPVVSNHDLALHLAEALQGSIFAEKDSETYLRQIQIENQKVSQLRFTLNQVKQYKKNPPANPSRMDPMLSYDEDLLAKEIEECKTRVQEWTRVQEESLNKAKKLKVESVRIQKELDKRKKQSRG